MPDAGERVSVAASDVCGWKRMVKKSALMTAASSGQEFGRVNGNMKDD